MDEKITPYLDKGEKLIATGNFQTRISVYDREEAAGFDDLANRNHVLGVTDKRLILAELDRKTSETSAEKITYVDFADVKIESDGLAVKIPGHEKSFKYWYVFGYKVPKEQFEMFYPGFLEAIVQHKK